MTYQIDQARQTIRTRCYGTIAMSDVLEHFHELESDPARPALADVILDVSDVQSLPEPHQLTEVIVQIRRVRSSILFGACAIVASGDAVYGTMRIFETYAEGAFRAIRTFRTAAEAEEWLGHQQSAEAQKS